MEEEEEEEVEGGAGLGGAVAVFGVPRGAGIGADPPISMAPVPPSSSCLRWKRLRPPPVPEGVAVGRGGAEVEVEEEVDEGVEEGVELVTPCCACASSCLRCQRERGAEDAVVEAVAVKVEVAEVGATEGGAIGAAAEGVAVDGRRRLGVAIREQ